MDPKLHGAFLALAGDGERNQPLPSHLRREHLLSQGRLDAVATRGYLRAWYTWERHLLGEGGLVVEHPEEQEYRLADLLVRAQLVRGDHVQRAGAQVCLDEEGSLERVAAELWLAGTTAEGEHDIAAIGYGYALREDAVWRRHIWMVTPEYRYLEIGEPAIAYIGVGLSCVDSLVFSALHAR